MAVGGSPKLGLAKKGMDFFRCYVGLYLYIYISISLYIHIYIYMCRVYRV